MDLHLLLSRAGIAPSMPLRLEAAADAPLAPPRPPPDYLTDTSADPNLLKKQRWALVVPEGPRGDRLRSILEPLRKLREQEQEAKAEVFTVPPRMTDEEALAYRDRYLQPSSRPTREHPRYVLFAGPPDVMPLELQDVVSGDGTGFAGRIAFESEAGYEAYVAKVLESERRPRRGGQVPTVLASVSDGLAATEMGRERLVEPLARQCQEQYRTGHFASSQVTSEALKHESPDRLITLAGIREPGVLFTLSHGVGPPRDGWRSPDEQRRQQGNLFLGGNASLMAEDVRDRPFLPGGIWFYFACFGAGTPLRSAYQSWVEHLAADDPSFRRTLQGIEASRPLDGRPFVGALAQAALANPEGPLAVIAHQDLAWSYSFVDARNGRSHVERFVRALSDLVEGHRVGVALQALVRFAQQVDDKIRKLDRGRMDPASRAHLWMERHDLASYVLLGDPATRISLEHERHG